MNTRAKSTLEEKEIKSNWAEEMLISVEEDILALVSQEKKANKEKDEEKERQYRLMRKSLEKQLLDLYRHAVKLGTPFCSQRLKKYEQFHYPKKLFLSDPQLDERNVSDVYKISTEDEMFRNIEEKKKQNENTPSIDLSFLSARQKETLSLYADGLSYSDIGELLDVKKGTVSKHLQLARAKASEKFLHTIQLTLPLEDDDFELEKSSKTKKQRKKLKTEKQEPDVEQLTLNIKVKTKKAKIKK